MPFDDLKTLPEGFATTPTMQPVAWAVPDRDDGEIWHVTMWRDEAIRAAGGNAFALIPLYTLGVRLSGVAAGAGPATPVLPSEFKAAAPVARAPEQRHDAATCRGERHEPDVGEGWRWVKPGEILRDGDEYLPYWSRDDENPWREINCTGMSVGANEPRTYRRRVTHEVPEAVRFPAATAMAERRKDEEIATLKAQVERLQQDLSRMYLTKKERKAVAFAEEHFRYFKNQALTLRGLRQRLEGGS